MGKINRDCLNDSLNDWDEGFFDDFEAKAMEIGQGADQVGEMFQIVHSIKGSVGFIGMERLNQIIQRAESALGDLRDGIIDNAEGITDLLLKLKDLIMDAIKKTADAGVEVFDEGLFSELEKALDEFD